MPSREAWADGYYAQASADWAMFRELRLRDDVPLCYALHYLRYSFPSLDLRQNPHARVFLNFVQASFEEYAGSDVTPS